MDSCCLLVTSEKVSSDWKWLGRHLKVDETAIKNIEAENPKDQREQAFRLLHTWFRKEKKAATRKVLTEALTACERDDIVHDLGEHYELKVRST